MTGRYNIESALKIWKNLVFYKNFINFPICLHFRKKTGYNEFGKAARGREAAKNIIFTEVLSKPGFYFSGASSARFPRLTDKKVSERVSGGIFRNNISRSPFGERTAAGRGEKQARSPPSLQSGPRALSAVKNDGKLSKMGDAAVNFCYDRPDRRFLPWQRQNEEDEEDPGEEEKQRRCWRYLYWLYWFWQA